VSFFTLFLLSVLGLLSGSFFFMMRLSEGVTVSAAVTTVFAAQLFLVAVLTTADGSPWNFPASRLEKVFWVLTFALFAFGSLGFHGLATLQHLFSTAVFLLGL
jgi:hypothetical protein